MKKLLVLLCALLTSAAALAQSPPRADSYVASSAPNGNFGAKPILAVQVGVDSFVQFDLSAIPAGSTVNKATLRLYVDAFTGPGSFDVYEVTSAWSEKTVTYSTMPTIGNSATGGNATAINATLLNRFVLIDITSLAQQWVSGSLANNGIALRLTTATGSFSFDSKESQATSHEPELEIALDGPAGAQGPQGIQGPAGPQGAQGPQGLPGNMTPGSPYYIQNGTTKQTGTSFNIDGSGTVGGTLTGNLVNSAQGFQIGGVTQLNFNSANVLMLGPSAGNATVTGGSSQLIGDHAGNSLTTGNADVFVGSSAGKLTTTGNGDVYVGEAAGESATTAAYNVFLGAQTGATTTTGSYNTFLGFNAGLYNSTGANNVYVGQGSGVISTTANSNTFVGYDAGYYNTTGSNNTFLGIEAGAYNTTGSGNIYLYNVGVGAENNTIRIGTGQTAAFISGIYGANAPSAMPVFINSNGQLGTSGGTIPASLLTGTYNQAITFSNGSNVYDGASLSLSGAATVGGSITASNLVSINGIVETDGAVFAGTGFTVTHNYTGNFTVNFAPGSFNPNSYPVISIQPISAPTVLVNLDSLGINADGSAEFNVDFGGFDVNFLFLANTTTPSAAAAGATPSASLAGSKEQLAPASDLIRRLPVAPATPTVKTADNTNAALLERVQTLEEDLKQLQQQMAELKSR